MKVTRVIAGTLVIATAVLVTGIADVKAQTLRNASPPAEFPPSSYKGKQYVDSRGCIYIRAGIDGNVTWVPRVDRGRRQICGYKPTAVAGTTQAPTSSAKPPVLITVPEADQPAATASAKPKAKPTAAAKPAATAQAAKPKPTARPQPVAKATPKPVATKPKPKAAATAAAPRPKPAKPAAATVASAPAVAPRTVKPAPTAPTETGGCANASALSQRYINTGPGVRCGPQAEPAITYGKGAVGEPQSSLRITPDTRVVPRHVYENRQNVRNVKIPKGYRAVWDDDRLNPYRAERTLAPAVVDGKVKIPRGYVVVDRHDDRFNPQRGVLSERGNAQTNLVWTQEVPRRLVRTPATAQVVVVPMGTAKSPAEATRKGLFVVSTRSDPNAAVRTSSSGRKYIRVGTFTDPGKAQDTARTLSASGLPIRMGKVNRKGRMLPVVLAGPYSDLAVARRDLAQLRSQGFTRARLSK